MSSTYVSLSTYTHSVTYVSEKILLCLKEIIRESGLSPSRLAGDWDFYQKGIQTWMESEHLISVYLEIKEPSEGKLLKRWDFDLDYDACGDLGMWVDTEDVRYHLRKKGAVPSQCDYRIIVKTKPGAPDLPGWSSTSLSSTDGLTRHSIGTTVSGENGVSSRTSYWS